MIPPARASALTASSSASTRAVRTRSLASPAESRQAWRSQAAVDTAPVTPAAPRRSKTTSRRANSDSSRETATRSPTRSAARAESGSPATSTASSRSSIGSRQPASTAPRPPALPTAPLSVPEHMFDSVVDPSDETGTFHMKPADLVPMKGHQDLHEVRYLIGRCQRKGSRRSGGHGEEWRHRLPCSCLLYTSDAADEEDSVDLGGR